MPRITTGILLASVLVLALPNTTQAICEDVENGIGVYFDTPTYEVNCLASPPVSTQFSMYFVLRNCTFSEIRAYEFAWRFSPEPQGDLLSLGCVPACRIDFPDCDNLISGCPTPLPTAGPALLMRVELSAVVPIGDTYVQVGPTTPASP